MTVFKSKNIKDQIKVFKKLKSNLKKLFLVINRFNFNINNKNKVKLFLRNLLLKKIVVKCWSKKVFRK